MPRKILRSNLEFSDPPARHCTLARALRDLLLLRESFRRWGGVVIDPGAEPATITAALSEAGLRCEAILITHAHYDHVGAVAPIARGHGCPVYISSGESHMLENLEKEVAPGFGPLESYEADVKLQGDERFSLAGWTFKPISRRVIRPPGWCSRYRSGVRPGRAVRRRRDLPRLGGAHRFRRRVVRRARGLDRTAVRDAARSTRRCCPATPARPRSPTSCGRTRSSTACAAGGRMTPHQSPPGTPTGCPTGWPSGAR